MWWARWSIWIVGCACMTSAVIGNAFYQKKQFYPTVVYITKSKPSMAVMYAQGLLFVVMLGKLFRKLFFGQLRAAEFEHLVERSWYAVTETCLAFTVFRDDFSPKFLALFTFLLFLKSFHWLAEERVDYMERSPVITWVFHVRVLSLLSILLLLDAYFVHVAYQSTISKGASVQLVFGFEYAILTTIVLNTLAKYIFHVIDMQNETPWENKAVFVLHTEVVIGLFKVILYILFVVIMVRIYTLPLFALRPTYLALRAFKKALNDVIMSRRAINNMNNLYPDVTQEELANTDNVCIICREEMTGGAKKLPCNHIFHVSCLRSWFQRQQTCPTCRLNVLRVPTPPNGAAQGVGAGVGAGNFPAVNQFPGGFQPQAPVYRGGAQAPQQPPAFGPQQPPAFGPQQPAFGLWGGVPPWAQQQAAQAAAAGGAPANQPAAAPQPGRAPAAGQQQNANAPDAAGSQTTPNVNVPPGFNPITPPPGFGANVPGRPPFPFPFGPNLNPGFGPRPPTAAAGDFPFAIPPMPYIPLVPPPPPLLQTTGLSDEDLRRMEGTSRTNVEARLRCLRNVQILLDSAVVQMQQYTAIVNNLNISTEPTSVPAPEDPVPSSSQSQAKSNVEKQVNTEMNTNLQNNLNGTGDTSDSAGVSASSRDASSSLPANTSSAIPPATETSSSSPVPLSEQEELRRRRLQRFSNSPEAQTQ